ncbi:metal-dependent hydrolase family protein [Wenzhouxiangella limi]|uniref:Amidohydrolase family protein n=1 Tax=Wenzhouxiangella limi TaxID=2707351 RepID=A0A845V157_9GAMM|nr:amidohydrolase family protein [Wenzhouxiangella limi]NDY96464.1 amidohydrolase family protein [Wenzhouxiangella limi]
MLKKLVMLAMIIVPAGPVLADQTWLRCGALVDVDEGRTLGAHTIVVEDGKIESVRTGSPEAPNDAEVLDLSVLTCLPGLMDMHTHITSQSSPDSYLRRFTANEADVALRGAHYAKLTLEAGFTTIRDLGDAYNASIALRDAIDEGMVPGPRIVTAAKSLATTGGHADPTNGHRRDLMGDPGPREGVVNGAADARKAVRQRYKDGADLIKITATGGVLSVARSGQNPQFTEAEVAEIVRIAADYEMHVAAHAHGTEGMQRAIRGGVHSIEHGTYMDDETIDLMIEHQTWYVPTVSAGRFVANMAVVDGYFPPVVAAKAAEIGPLIQETFGRAHAAGVRIAFGTDCGVCPHGDNALEFQYMVEAGMSPADALRSATLRAAELLGRTDDLGRLRPGYLADVIAVPSDPLADVAALMDVRFVMREGGVYKTP